MEEQKKIQDFTIEELKQFGFDLYQQRTQASQLVTDCNNQLQLINNELAKRNQAPVEQLEKIEPEETTEDKKDNK